MIGVCTITEKCVCDHITLYLSQPHFSFHNNTFTACGPNNILQSELYLFHIMLHVMNRRGVHGNKPQLQCD